MGGKIVRTIGIVRAKFKTGMMNLGYNIRRLVQLGWRLRPPECAHGWSPYGMVQRTARSPARHQTVPDRGLTLARALHAARSAKPETAKAVLFECP
jgi:hypothetical protein